MNENTRPASLDELQIIVSHIRWFHSLGRQTDVHLPTLWLPSMEAWSGVTGILEHEHLPDVVEQGMQWLPTQSGEPDPYHAPALQQLVKERGMSPEPVMMVYRRAAESLRQLERYPLLTAGAHDFTVSAKNGALYTVRHTAYELILGIDGPWCRMMGIYATGHWPLGVMPDGRIVVL